MEKAIGLAFVSLWSVIPMASGCHACTEAGCTNGVMLEFAPLLGAPGEYRLSGTIDGKDFSCEVTLPIQAAAVCSSTEWRVDVYASAPGDAQKIHGLHLDSTPTNITIAVERDGTNIGQATAGLTYETVRPNGESCPPECRVGKKLITLTP